MAELIKEEEFEALPKHEQEAYIDQYDREVRNWVGVCMRCGNRVKGKMAELSRQCVKCGFKE